MKSVSVYMLYTGLLKNLEMLDPILMIFLTFLLFTKNSERTDLKFWSTLSEFVFPKLHESMFLRKLHSALSFHFLGTSMLFSLVTAAVCIPPTVWDGCLFPHPL